MVYPIAGTLLKTGNCRALDMLTQHTLKPKIECSMRMECNLVNTTCITSNGTHIAPVQIQLCKHTFSTLGNHFCYYDVYNGQRKNRNIFRFTMEALFEGECFYILYR